MNNSKTIGELPSLAAANSSTKLVVEHTYSNGVSNTFQLSVANLFAFSTPANSTITITKGTMLYDTNYLYVAVANNTLKRVSLSSF